jgi:two-component system chemotaxis response regulator CheY
LINLAMEDIKVLVVDDIRIMRRLLISSLNTLDITGIEQADNATTALEIFNGSIIHIVFLDINMPDVSGLELIKQLCSINPDVFIIMVSADSSIDNVKKSIALGAKGFIVKPYSSDRIKFMIDKYKVENQIN